MEEVSESLYEILNDDNIELMHRSSAEHPIGFAAGGDEVWMSYKAATLLLEMLKEEWGDLDEVVMALGIYLKNKT